MCCFNTFFVICGFVIALLSFIPHTFSRCDVFSQETSLVLGCYAVGSIGVIARLAIKRFSTVIAYGAFISQSEVRFDFERRTVVFLRARCRVSMCSSIKRLTYDGLSCSLLHINMTSTKSRTNSMQVKAKRGKLLRHPLVVSLLNHKWRSYGRWVYFINLFIYLCFMGFLNSYMLTVPPPYAVGEYWTVLELRLGSTSLRLGSSSLDETQSLC